MGKGVDAIRDENPEHAAMIDDLKDQLLIVFLKRLGGNIDIPVTEIDDTGQDTLSMSVNKGVFHFEINKKSWTGIFKTQMKKKIRELFPNAKVIKIPETEESKKRHKEVMEFIKGLNAAYEATKNSTLKFRATKILKGGTNAFNYETI